MRNVAKIIDLFGGMSSLERRPIRLEVPQFMRLVLEHIGTGPRGLPMISIAHYGEQNGDAMRDPEITFEVCRDPNGNHSFLPVSIQNDYVGSYRVAAWQDEQDRVMLNPREARDIAYFSRIWDRNLKHQGFVDAAKRVAVPF